MKKIPVLMAGLLTVAAATAQEAPVVDELPAAEETEQIRQYSVEVIIFAYAEDVALGSEIFVPDEIVPPADTGTEADDEVAATDEAALQDEPLEDLEEELREIIPFAARSLATDELTMTDTLGRLERLDAYEPLMHFGWVQPTIPRDQTPLLPLARFGLPPAGLDGTLQLYLNRFLHLAVDVSLAAPQERWDPDPGYRETRAPGLIFSDRPVDDSLSQPVFAPLRYRIEEDRIMKNGETRYFDHPKIGVIAKVLRIEEQSEDEPEQSGAF